MPAARLAHAALTSPLPVVGGTWPGWPGRRRVVREMEFLFPFPEAAGGARRGFVKGFVDVVFQHEGRAYLIDWKTDRLSSWDAATVEAHVTANYDLQERLYALALARALGIARRRHATRRASAAPFMCSCAGCPARCAAGGPASPSLQAWDRELGDQLAAARGAEVDA